MNKKIMSCLLLGLLIASSFSTIVIADMTNEEKKAKITEYQQSIEQQFNSQFEEVFFNAFFNGNTSILPAGWKFCGPAYVESEGKGLFFEKFRLKLALNLATPSMFRIMRWWNFCKYYNLKAETTIKPVVGREISLKGPHSVIAGTLIKPSSNIIGTILSGLEEKSQVVDRLFGDAVWDWGLWVYGIGESPLEDQPFLNFLYNNVKMVKLLYLFRFPLTVIYMLSPIKVPLYGFYQTLDFSGFSPFVLYKE